MSTYSEAWHDTPPAVRDFYRNFHNRYLRQARRVLYTPGDGIDDWFNTIGWEFHAYSGFAIAMHNWTVQTATFGSFNRSWVYLRTHVGYSDPSPGPPYTLVDFISWADQWIDIPDLAWNYPRPKRNAPRSYWTGAPRRRRNL